MPIYVNICHTYRVYRSICTACTQLLLDISVGKHNCSRYPYDSDMRYVGLYFQVLQLIVRVMFMRFTSPSQVFDPSDTQAASVRHVCRVIRRGTRGSSTTASSARGARGSASSSQRARRGQCSPPLPLPREPPLRCLRPHGLSAPNRRAAVSSRQCRLATSRDLYYTRPFICLHRFCLHGSRGS